MFDFGIRSKNTVTPAGIMPYLVLMKQGLIAELAPLGTEVTCPVIDINDHVLLPGLIDPHVHINEPGRTDWEGFDTATKAALAGGLTTLIDMPLNASPVTTSVAAFEKKLAATQNQLHTNCGFWGGIVPGNTPEIEKLINSTNCPIRDQPSCKANEEKPDIGICSRSLSPGNHPEPLSSGANSLLRQI